MLKKLPFIIAFASIALGATSAQALSIGYVAGNAGADPLQGTTIFQNFDALTAGQPFGGGNAIFAGSVGGQAARPAFWSTGNFLAVQANNTSSVTINVPKTQVLSFVLGSLDGYNRVVLKFLTGPDKILDGIDIIGGTVANGNQFLANQNGRVYYDTQGLNSIVGFELTSFGSNAFEVDNISIAVPEPATWGMLILTAGIAGTALRRRRNRSAMA